MTEGKRRVLVTTWRGAYVLEGGKVVGAYPFPTDESELIDRTRLRRTGALAPEEEVLLAEHAAATLESRDRRFEPKGVRWVRVDARAPNVEGDPTVERAFLLEGAAQALRASWDPSVQVQEAVRARGDLDRALNLVSERLSSWAGRDALGRGTEPEDDPGRLAETLLDAGAAVDPDLPAPDPKLLAARQALARFYLEGTAARRAIDAAVESSAPAEAPNLSALLGPDLAARLLSLGGGVDRLARLPASTLQVLGAERAFFEHLRGRAPPPRHGVLFLHPLVQSAPRHQRGKLARALAGKASIAARLDANGGALHPEIREAFERRAAEIRATRRPGGKARGRSALPLHRAPEDG